MDTSIFDPMHKDFMRIMKLYNKPVDPPLQWFHWFEIMDNNFDTETMFEDIEDRSLAFYCYRKTNKDEIKVYLKLKFGL